MAKTKYNDWDAIQDWLNEMTGWANAERCIHLEKTDQLSEWLAKMKQPYLAGIRSQELFDLIESEWRRFSATP